MIIAIDSREQMPLPIKAGADIEDVITTKLPFGDYAMKLDATSPYVPVFFERKNIEDLWGTLTTGIDRFKRELERAKESKVTMYLAIEGTMLDVYTGSMFSIVPGSQIIRSIFTFKMKYGLQPVFCPNREQMKYYIIETFDAVRRVYEKASPLKNEFKGGIQSADCIAEVDT